MKPFLDDHFLLSNQTAERLYFDFAKDMPIIDYHNHLSPEQIRNDTVFDNITQVWLYGDHYKWRAMRTMGVDESYITGDKSDADKFNKWAETVPYTLRNPLYHWTHLELKRYFGINEILNPQSAGTVFQKTRDLLSQRDYSVNGLLSKMNVEMVCTTDDPLDSLEFHDAVDHPSFGNMFPAFRPDRFFNIAGAGFLQDISRLGDLTATSIQTYSDLVSALKTRADFFVLHGCKLADHGLESMFAAPYTADVVAQVFSKALSGQKLNSIEIAQYRASILFDLASMYHDLGWVQQFHLGALRNNNTAALRKIGPDTGWDSVGDFSQAVSLSAFLGRLAEESKLTKTIIYNLNPADNEVFATMIGNFNDGSVRGKIQMGSAWWFLDQKDGMEKQINALSNMGLLSCFVGMLTDSRSFLSFPRHEYFRRILCNLFGREIEKGELPNDINWTGKIIQDICYNNIKQYLGL